MIITPLHISILLAANAGNKTFIGQCYGSPAHREYERHLVKNGYIECDPIAHPEKFDTDYEYRLTKKGQCWLEAAQAIPEPVNVWIIPDKDKSE